MVSTDFYQRFWNIIAADVHEVLLECFRTGSLPVSCQKAVLSLLPKNWDLASLKNSRPLALLCTDGKLLSIAVSNRLKEFLEITINTDQSDLLCP